jgi:CRISPR/Cas system-associated exonuclease Cas4 (RecB family)/muconolactone delta-isomerase
MRALVASPRSELRLARARAFLEALAPDGDALLLGASSEAVAELTRSLRRPVFGWRRATVPRAALELARPALLARGVTPLSPLSTEALWARVTWELAQEGALGRLAPIAGRPGLARALGRTAMELRLTEAPRDALEPAVAAALARFEKHLAEARLADRVEVYRLAIEAVSTSPRVPLVLLDLAPADGLELRFVEAIARHASAVLALCPRGEEMPLAGALGCEAEMLDAPEDGPAGALQQHLFSATRPRAAFTLDDFFSAPGEGREAVELARRVLELASQGVRFDDIAVLLRSPTAYRAPLEDAFRRAGVPAFFSSGLPRPDPAGRALLALLCCAEEGLSARRFSEYLSLAQVPRPDAAGAPPAARPGFARPESVESLLAREGPGLEPAPSNDEPLNPDAPVVAGQLRAPRRWEQLIIDASVIGGVERWRRRLAGLRARKDQERAAPTTSEGQARRLAREVADLEALEDFALPLLEELHALPASAPWGPWLDALASLATRALKAPERVLSVLAELSPLRPVGPVGLGEVRAVLGERLATLTEAPEGRRFGHVLIAPIDAARGLSFDTVFVPGLAERGFPQKLREDPLLQDAVRAQLSPRLEVMADRVARERQALRLAVGAARRRVVLSYPRVDGAQSRPRVPSFYALEAARAVTGTLPGFEALQRLAESARVRLAWPAPAQPERAIDDAEFDLAVLEGVVRATGPVKGRARYLLDANPHLARALRARLARWSQSAWTPHDGLVKPGARAHEALAVHQFAARPFSPTALEQYAACPYRFFLSTVVRLSPLEVPGDLEALGPMEKGSMAHEVQYLLLSRLRDEGVAVTPETETLVFHRLDAVVEEVSSAFYDRLKPAIERVWRDGLETLKADVREWLRRVARDAAWRPARFELSFGLPGREQSDPASRAEPVTVMEGLRLRGSIDLVEEGEGGVLRATDYKTGRAKAKPGNVVGGGRHLQPVLYALVLEQLFPGHRVAGGRLYYCTQTGEFLAVDTPLDATSREAMGAVVRTIRGALETGFFPAAPAPGECRHCDYRPVCGPDEERRLSRTRKGLRAELNELRGLRARR